MKQCSMYCLEIVIVAWSIVFYQVRTGAETSPVLGLLVGTMQDVGVSSSRLARAIVAPLSLWM